MAGYPISAAELNSKAGAVVTNVWDALDQVNRMYKWMNDATHTDNLLVVAPFNIPQADLDLIRPAIADLGSTTAGLWAVAHNLKTVSPTNDFFFNAKKLTGVNFTG